MSFTRQLSSVDQPPLPEQDVEKSAAEMDKKAMDKKKEIQNMERDERYVKRRQLEEAAEDEKKVTSAPKNTGNRPGVLDIFEPVPVEAPAEDDTPTSRQSKILTNSL